MSRERIEQTVSVLHQNRPFERDPSKIRSNLDLLANKLGLAGLQFVQVRGTIEFSRRFEFGDPNTVWLASDFGENPLIIDPHHPVFDDTAQRAMSSYAISGDKDSYAQLKRRVTDLLPDPEIFPLGKTREELCQRGVVYRPSPNLVN